MFHFLYIFTKSCYFHPLLNYSILVGINYPAGSCGAAGVSESRRLQRSSGVEGGSPIPAAGLPASPPTLAGGAAAPLLSNAPAGRQPGEQQEEEEAMVKKTSCCPSCSLPS